MKTGTGSYGLDLLILGALIAGGTWFSLWYLTSPPNTHALVTAWMTSRAALLTTFVLAQPGLIGGVKLIMDTNVRPSRRFALGAAVLAVFGIALPIVIGNALQAKLASLF